MSIKVLFQILVLFVPQIVVAGQAVITNTEGTPVLWDTSSSSQITLHPEAGACGHLSNSEAISTLTEALTSWTSLSTVDLSFLVDETGISVDVDGDNYDDYLVNVEFPGTTSEEAEAISLANIQDNINPVLFDDDGLIIDRATGLSNGRFTVLGFANPAGFLADGTTGLIRSISDAQAVFNCYCLEDESGDPANDDCSSADSLNQLKHTIIHEMGHFVGMDHSQVGADFVSDGDSDNDDDISVMFPFSVNSDQQMSLVQDDITTFSSLYPSSSFTSSSSSDGHCLVTGTLKDPYNRELRCADVQAVADDTFYTVAFVSGAYAVAEDATGDTDTVDQTECTDDCGKFEFYLLPSQSYTLRVASIDSLFVDASRLMPCFTAQLPECTGTNQNICSQADTSCVPCVETETITQNTDGQSLASLISGQCTAGATVDLGTISTTSVSLETYYAILSGEDLFFTETTSSGGGCSLQKGDSLGAGSVVMILMPFFGFLFVFRVFRSRLMR